MTLKEFVRGMIETQLGMLNMQIAALRGLRDRTENSDKKEGIQDCIDILEEAVITGKSITDEEIYKKVEALDEVLTQIMASKQEGKEDN
jgi:hypothetical protein